MKRKNYITEEVSKTCAKNRKQPIYKKKLNNCHSIVSIAAKIICGSILITSDDEKMMSNFSVLTLTKNEYYI
jgi:hypothetical protein